MGVMGVLILFDKEVSRVKAYPFIIYITFFGLYGYMYACSCIYILEFIVD